MNEGADWLEQARRLVAGLGDAWTESAAGSGGAGGAGTDTGGHVPDGDCRFCPLCRAAAVARRPEVNEALADLLANAAVALRSLAEAPPARQAPPAREEPPGEPEPPADPAPRAAPVQHIELG